ncbi:acetyl-CoA carboxylase carboxyl transferase subunit beta [Chlamydiia bacterium]|nr:acetyl-CoA carboxylase carboxyl transferase subunit beta [Chlamydiia bacterium]
MIQWDTCPRCKKKELHRCVVDNSHICSMCEHHYSYSAAQYLSLIFDDSRYTPLFTDITTQDIISFKCHMSYNEIIKKAVKRTGSNESIVCATGFINGVRAVVMASEFGFIGGTIGVQTGLIIEQAALYAEQHNCSLIAVIRSGGMRMHESTHALMQMPRTLAAIQRFKKTTYPFIVYLCNPSTGGTLASFATQGDFTYAEPNATIAFTGKRVIEQTTYKKINTTEQTAETCLQRGLIDGIVHRKDIKRTISKILYLFNGDIS